MIEENTILKSEFYSELYREDSNETFPAESTDHCLITHEPLTDHYQTLTCGHKFNYVPLYKYIYNYKYTYGIYAPKFRVDAYKCPYCRCIQTELIPYIPIGDIIETLGVNVEELYTKRSITCMYTYCNNTKQCLKSFLRQLSPSTFYCATHFHKMQQSPQVDTIVPKCTYIFVKGKSKGEQCRSSVISDMLCKKHLHTNNKSPLPPPI